jgi:hypothetical protein
MRALLWSYLGSRRFPREMSTFEIRRCFTLSSDDRHVCVISCAPKLDNPSAHSLDFARVKV